VAKHTHKTEHKAKDSHEPRKEAAKKEEPTATAAKKEKVKTDKDGEVVVKMKFSSTQFYRDPDVPIFNAGEVYEVKGAEWINRWLKRGGEIVEGALPIETDNEMKPSSISKVADGSETKEDGKENEALV